MKVDVVIPTIGRPSLVKAVRSVASQTAECRAIVVLDRPEKLDDVRALLLGLSYELIVTEGGSRAASARNLGLMTVTAPVVAFLDDDDWWGPTRVERLLSSVPDTDNKFVVASAFRFVLPGGKSRIVPTHKPPFEPSAKPRAELLADYLVTRAQLKFGTNAMQTSSLLMSTQAANETRWDEDLPKHQDWDLILRLAQDSATQFIWADTDECYVVKDSTDSISKRMNWQASLYWLDRHRTLLSKQAASDFAWVHILRASLATRSVAGIFRFVSLRATRPHAAAVVVALEGFARGVRTVRPRAS